VSRRWNNFDRTHASSIVYLLSQPSAAAAAAAVEIAVTGATRARGSSASNGCDTVALRRPRRKDQKREPSFSDSSAFRRACGLTDFSAAATDSN
jgi:hypothetical protein